jgi:hypothetical protein
VPIAAGKLVGVVEDLRRRLNGGNPVQQLLFFHLVKSPNGVQFSFCELTFSFLSAANFDFARLSPLSDVLMNNHRHDSIRRLRTYGNTSGPRRPGHRREPAADGGTKGVGGAKAAGVTPRRGGQPGADGEAQHEGGGAKSGRSASRASSRSSMPVGYPRLSDLEMQICR